MSSPVGRYWTSAADLGFAPALYNLGVMFMNGQGVERGEFTR